MTIQKFKLLSPPSHMGHLWQMCILIIFVKGSVNSLMSNELKMDHWRAFEVALRRSLSVTLLILSPGADQNWRPSKTFIQKARWEKDAQRPSWRGLCFCDVRCPLFHTQVTCRGVLPLSLICKGGVSDYTFSLPHPNLCVCGLTVVSNHKHVWMMRVCCLCRWSFWL